MADLKAIGFRHHDIQYNQIEVIGLASPDARLPIFGCNDLVSLILQDRPGQTQRAEIIIDHQDFTHLSGNPVNLSYSEQRDLSTLLCVPATYRINLLPNTYYTPSAFQLPYKMPFRPSKNLPNNINDNAILLA